MAKQKCSLPCTILRLFPLFRNRNVSVLENKNSLTVKISEEPDTKQSKKITFKTFKNRHSKKTETETDSAKTDEQQLYYVIS